MKEKAVKPLKRAGKGSSHRECLSPELKLLSRAAREQWPMSEAKRAEIIEKMHKIVAQETQTIYTPEGSPVEVSNSRNQAAAARVLAQLDGINQTDYWNADKNKRLDEGKATERIGGVDVKFG